MTLPFYILMSLYRLYILIKCSNRTLSHSLQKSNQRRYKFLDLNFDLRLDSLYFNRKSMGWVMQIIRLWPDFSKVAKHGFKECSWWKGFLFTCSYHPYMFQSEKSQNKLNLMQSFLLKRFTKFVKMNFKREQSKNCHASVILNSHFAWIFTKALFYILSRFSASKRLRKALKLPRKHAIMNERSVQI